jgi:NAD(P)H-nitrite reductase large subunit
LNIKDKECSLADGKRIYFEKLIIATGSVPTKPKWLKGSDLENVFTIPKNKVYLDKMYSKLKELKRVITIGAGFIGVEVSDEMNKAGWMLPIEIEPNNLNKSF